MTGSLSVTPRSRHGRRPATPGTKVPNFQDRRRFAWSATQLGGDVDPAGRVAAVVGDIAALAVDLQRTPAGDVDVARMTARLPHPYTEFDAEEWIRGIEDNEFVRGIEFENYLIGLIGYTIDANDRSAELGYWIGRPWWGRGFVTEAAGK